MKIHIYTDTLHFCPETPKDGFQLGSLKGQNLGAFNSLVSFQDGGPLLIINTDLLNRVGRLLGSNDIVDWMDRIPELLAAEKTLQELNLS